MAKPFLILQLRPEDETADNELAALIQFGGLAESEIHRVRIEKESLPNIDLDDYSATYLGGGPYNLSDDEATKPGEQKRFEAELAPMVDKIIATDFPYFGGCYGLSYLAQRLGAAVSTEKYAETVEATTITLSETATSDPLTKNLPNNFRAIAGHHESVQALPPGATLLASSPICPIHMIRYKQNIYATQFHTELDKEGTALRIRFYKYHGYFKPEDADQLIEAIYRENIVTPPKILHRFVARYRR